MEIVMAETQRHQFNTILNAIPDIMVLVADSMSVFSVNAAWTVQARSFGASEAEKPAGMGYFHACEAIGIGNEKFAEDAAAAMHEILGGTRASFEMEYPCHGEEPRYWLLRASAIPAESGPMALCAHVDITRRKLAEIELARETRKLREQSLTDPLTGLRNRRALELLGRQYWANAQRRGGVLAVFFFDLDDFKPVNDNFGHEEGDRALCFIAEYLQSTFRDSDVVARVGGDEFVVLAWMAAAEDLDIVMARLQLQHRMTSGGGDVYTLGMSVGHAVHDPKQEGDLVTLISKADTQMYQNKKGRKKRG